jgi:signal peptidase I
MTVPRPAKPSQPPPTSTKPPEPARPKTKKEEAIAWAKAIGTALLIWIVIRSFLVEAFRIPSASMENTLLIGDFLFVNKAVYGGELEVPLVGFHCCRLPSFGTPHRDLIVVFRSWKTRRTRTS